MVNPRFPAPVNTYNPTVHAMVDAIFEALSHVIPGRVRADGCGSRSIIIGGRSTYGGKGYVQYEIIGGGAGARASKDGASGTSVNQSNAKIAPVEIIESEFPTRLQRFELIRDSGGAGDSAAGSASAANISISRRRASRSARPSTSSRRTAAPAAATAAPATSGSIRTPTRPSACRPAMPTIR